MKSMGTIKNPVLFIDINYFYCFSSQKFSLHGNERLSKSIREKNIVPVPLFIACLDNYSDLNVEWSISTA